MYKSKILALYLPQFHEFPENDRWWGKGYTEWTAVKQSHPQFEGHLQPVEPLNDYYYDLSDIEGTAWKWQAKIAKKYGIFGFCIYHYWFGINDMLMMKPMEILLAHPEIDINYCICWANESWARNWYGQNNTILKEQTYGGEKDYVAHFEYMLQFFNDKRYIKIDNKPVINIYHTIEIEDLSLLREIWNNMAIKNGFSGVYIVSGRTMQKKIDERENLFDAYYTFEPGYTLSHKRTKADVYCEKARMYLVRFLRKHYNFKGVDHVINGKRIVKYMGNERSPSKVPIFPGAFVSWDNTPRRGELGYVFKYMSPNLFKLQLKKILENESDKWDCRFIFVNAWNEWGEGCHLEPDKYNRFSYLEVIKTFANGFEDD